MNSKNITRPLILVVLILYMWPAVQANSLTNALSTLKQKLSVLTQKLHREHKKQDPFLESKRLKKVSADSTRSILSFLPVKDIARMSRASKRMQKIAFADHMIGYPSIDIEKAAKAGDKRFVKQWLKHMDKNNETHQEQANSALFYSAYHHHPQVVKLILKSPIKIGARLIGTSIMYAAEASPETLRPFLQSNKVIIDEESAHIAIHSAAFDGRIQVLKMLIESPKVKLKQTRINLSFLWATYKNRTAVVSFFIKSKKVNIKREIAKKALEEAKEENYKDIVKLLEDYLKKSKD